VAFSLLRIYIQRWSSSESVLTISTHSSPWIKHIQNHQYKHSNSPPNTQASQKAIMAAAAGVIGAYLNLVGPLTTAITQIIALSSTLPKTANVASNSNNQVVVGVGLFEGGNQNDFGGDGLRVGGFSNQGTFVGSGQMPHMDQGQSFTTSLDPSSSSVGAIQVQQLTLQTSGANAVCVQYVELSWQGTVTSGFDGTWGQMCGQDWYHSESTWGQTSDGKSYRPACWWMDGTSRMHNTAQHPDKAIWVDMELVVSGAPVSGANTSTATFCNDNVMKFSSTGVDYDDPQVAGGLNKDTQGSGPSKRGYLHGRFDRRATPSEKPFPIANGTNPLSPTGTATNFPKPASTGTFVLTSGTMTQLVVSDFSDHSAATLCKHDKSRGPDFVSMAENLFCDMEARALYPLCSASKKSECFALDKDQKKISKRGNDESGANDALHRDYHKVTHWQ